MARLRDVRTARFSYPDVGATRDPARLPPPGYRLLRVRTRIGQGPAVLASAGRAVLDWRMHRALGVTIRTRAARAAPGARLIVGLGAGRWRIQAPCEVVWTVREARRIGFAYGTLDGHPERGEESFVVEVDDHGAVWLAVTAFSRPANWFTRAAGPVIPLLQRAYARRCGRVLRRLAAPGTDDAADGADAADAADRES